MIRADYFWRHARRGAADECWPWLGRLRKGYAAYCHWQASRCAYELEVGPIPEGLEIDHLCMNPACVNPAHLEPVTRLENMRRWSASITHCRHGHEYTEANTYTHRGHRYCRACGRRRAAELKARKRAQAATS